jgi:hypothetical protein
MSNARVLMRLFVGAVIGSIAGLGLVMFCATVCSAIEPMAKGEEAVGIGAIYGLVFACVGAAVGGMLVVRLELQSRKNRRKNRGLRNDLA